MSEGVPDELIGVWRRECLSLDGGEPYEDSDVIWLQSRMRFAEIRTPVTVGSVDHEAAGGKQNWRSPRLTFHREIDYSRNYPDDVGIFSWEGETLIEHGNVEVGGKTVAYMERWLRITPQNPAYKVLEQRDYGGTLVAIAVQVEQHLLTIASGDGFSANHFENSGDSWQHQKAVGRAQTTDFARDIVDGARKDFRVVDKGKVLNDG